VTSRDSWIRRFHPAPESKVRLVCLPHAGGSASFFFGVSAAMSPSVEVLAVQYPGRQDRRNEPGIERISDLADAVFTALLNWTDRPLALFGHSMGAALAFEVARRLELVSGVVPARLFVSGRRAPSCRRSETVHRRDDEGVVAELRLLSGTDYRLLGDEEILRMILPAIRSDYTAIENYRPDPDVSVSCPVTVLVGDQDPRTNVAEAQAWSAHTKGSFDLRTYPGGHFYLAQHRKDVIKVMLGFLAQLGSTNTLSGAPDSKIR
jgi:surfactin synthase thioesterase subunit